MASATVVRSVAFLPSKARSTSQGPVWCVMKFNIMSMFLVSELSLLCVHVLPLAVLVFEREEIVSAGPVPAVVQVLNLISQLLPFFVAPPAQAQFLLQEADVLPQVPRVVQRRSTGVRRRSTGVATEEVMRVGRHRCPIGPVKAFEVDAHVDLLVDGRGKRHGKIEAWQEARQEAWQEALPWQEAWQHAWPHQWR